MSGLGGIFGLFGFPEGDGKSPYGKREEDDPVDALKETPHFKVGMFCKMVSNGNNFTKHKEKDIVDCLTKTIKFYESTEEYEVCAFLKGLQDCIEETYP